jgi:hypothetical protein
MPIEIVRDTSGGSYTLVRQADPVTCGLAAVATTILARMNICPVQPPTEQSLLAQIGGAIPEGGLRRTQLAQLLTLNNIPHDVVTYNDTSTFIPALRDRIKPKKPGILHVMRGTAGNYSGHWVTAVSSKDDILVVLDPMFGLQEISFDFLPSYPFVQRGRGQRGTAAGVLFSGQCLLTN